MGHTESKSVTLGDCCSCHADSYGGGDSRTNLPQIESELGVSGTAAGLIITAHGGVIVLTSPVMGFVIDRIGPRRPFVGGLIVYGLGGGAGLVVESFSALLLSRVVLGIGTAAVYTSITVLIYTL